MAHFSSIRGETPDIPPPGRQSGSKKVSSYRNLLRRKSDKSVIRAQLDEAWNNLEAIRDEFRLWFTRDQLGLPTGAGTAIRDLESLQKAHDKMLEDYIALLESYLKNYKLDPEEDFYIFLRIGHIEQSDVLFQKLGLSDDNSTTEDVVRLLLLNVENNYRIYEKAPIEENLVDLFLSLSELNGYCNSLSEDVFLSDEIEKVINKCMAITEGALERKKKDFLKYLATGVKSGDSRLMRESARVVNQMVNNDPLARLEVSRRMLGAK